MIKEVKFEKLFSLEKYHNEKIGCTAIVNDGENADKTMADIILKVMDVEDCLSTYRELLSREERANYEVKSTENSIENLEDQIKTMKVKIEEITQAVKKGADVDERLHHACSSRSYKELKEQLNTYKDRLKKEAVIAEVAMKNRIALRERIKVGNFSLEGIDVPKPSRGSFDIY
jgi:DNA repair exonuclease SbcCD ATPase subunit